VHQVEPRLFMVAVGLVLAAGGLALATNFRGCVEWHARKTLELFRPLERPLTRIPPWKSVLSRSQEQRIARQVAMMRVMGAVFAAVGVVLIIAAPIIHFTRT
jgi:hypothetical protein